MEALLHYAPLANLLLSFLIVPALHMGSRLLKALERCENCPGPRLQRRLDRVERELGLAQLPDYGEL